MSSVSRRFSFTAALLAGLFSFAANAAQPAPFANMAGGWSGGGQLHNKDGGVERIRCRATYTVESGGAIVSLGVV